MDSKDAGSNPVRRPNFKLIMELQEKINKRIEELEVELEEVNREYQCLPIYSAADFTDYVVEKLNLTNQCIKELKQLLN